MGVIDHELTWRLSDPGMGLLERAGLAALFMTLRAAGPDGSALGPLAWSAADLTSDGVTVRWTGTAARAFTALIKFAWQVSEGVLYFPAVYRNAADVEHVYRRTAMHNGIAGTFLQHNRIQPKGEPIHRIDSPDEGKELDVRYQPFNIAERFAPYADISKFFDRKGNFRATDVKMSGWVFPGMSPRFGNEDAWAGPARIGLLLMLAPIACLYQQLHGQRGTWLFVVPDVDDLVVFDRRRPRLGLEAAYTDVATPADAGLKFLADYGWQEGRRRLGIGCRVVAVGKVGYYPNQSIRKGVADVSPTRTVLDRYNVLLGAMKNTYRLRTPPTPAASSAKTVRPKKTANSAKPAKNVAPQAAGWWAVPSGRGRIADNLIAGQRWYADLFDPPTWDRDALDDRRATGESIEHLWFRLLVYQKGSLMTLIQDKDMWDSPGEQLFVEAFWQILAALYYREGKAVERGGARTFEDRKEHLDEEIRRMLSRAKTRPLLRQTIVDLFTRPVATYRAPLVKQQPDVIWSLINHKHDWKRARDLALLALASYMNKDKRAAVGTEAGAAVIEQDETIPKGDA